MSRSSRNVIWEYFIKCETDISKAKCLECSKLLSLGSDKPGKQTVHGLKMHLEKCHKEVFNDYTAKVNAKAVIQEPPAKKAKLDVPGASQSKNNDFRFRPKTLFKFLLRFGFGRK